MIHMFKIIKKILYSNLFSNSIIKITLLFSGLILVSSYGFHLLNTSDLISHYPQIKTNPSTSKPYTFFFNILYPFIFFFKFQAETLIFDPVAFKSTHYFTNEALNFYYPLQKGIHTEYIQLLTKKSSKLYIHFIWDKEICISEEFKLITDFLAFKTEIQGQQIFENLKSIVYSMDLSSTKDHTQAVKLLKKAYDSNIHNTFKVLTTIDCNEFNTFKLDLKTQQKVVMLMQQQPTPCILFNFTSMEIKGF